MTKDGELTKEELLSATIEIEKHTHDVYVTLIVDTEEVGEVSGQLKSVSARRGTRRKKHQLSKLIQQAEANAKTLRELSEDEEEEDEEHPLR
jgi:hypothetical protein